MPEVRSYIICATPRSGSTLLCDLLEITGVAGRPASYFRKESIPRWAERLGVPVSNDGNQLAFGLAYIEAVIAAGRGGTDLFGLRIMRDSLDDLSVWLGDLFPGFGSDRDRLEGVFGPALFIYLSRADKVSQAISRVKAVQSGLWHVAADGTDRERTAPATAVVYDRGEIGRYVEELTADDRRWQDWFESNGIEPVRLTYEALSQDPRSALATILSALGLDPALADMVEPKTSRMSDGRSADWAARFRAEAGLPPVTE